MKRNTSALVFHILIVERSISQRIIQLYTDEALVFEKTDEIAARMLNVTFFSSNGEYFSRLWADSGLIDMESNDMTAIGNVIVVSEDSVRLETDRLFWNEEKEEISTEDSVVIYQKDQILRGKGLYADPGLEDIVILSPTGRFKEKDRTDKD